MAYDQGLAQRIKEILDSQQDFSENKNLRTWIESGVKFPTTSPKK